MTNVWAGTITVGPVGCDYTTIQAAITAANPGDVIKVAAGTYNESNILVDKSVTIMGIAASRDQVIIVPAAEDGNADNAFGNSAQNGFIIAAHAVTIRNLTIDGQGNTGLTPGKYNFRAGIVTLDMSQPGGGVWNNLHVDNVDVKNCWRRGISIWPRTVSGTVIENSTVQNIFYNQGMYLAGHSLVLNNTVRHCFQGIVQNPDPTTPTGLFKMNGNLVTEIGNYPGCYNYPNGQPRAIQFDAVDSTFRTVEIRNNTINDNGYSGPVGTVGIYTRRANAASLVENNTITLGSGTTFSTGTQAVGLLLGWSYGRAFTARLNHITNSGYGIGIMLVDAGAANAKPMILEQNVLNSSGSLHADRGDGTGIFISNEYLFNVIDKSECFVKIQNHNTISGYARGIEVEKVLTSPLPVTGFAHHNVISGNATGFVATGLTDPFDATSNFWGDCSGPNHPMNPAGLGNPVVGNVQFTPWWCDGAMTIPAPALAPGMAILNATTGVQFPAGLLQVALNTASNNDWLYVAPGVNPGIINFNNPGSTIHLVGSGIPGQSVIDGTFFIQDGSLVCQNGLKFQTPEDQPTVVVLGGSLKLRDCILVETLAGYDACLHSAFGSVDAGTVEDPGGNTFIGNGAGLSIFMQSTLPLSAVGNDWGSPSGPFVATSNPGGTGWGINGPGMDEVEYAPFTTGPVFTVHSVTACYGVTSVDIPVSVTGFSNVGKLSLTFGFTPAQLTNPTLVDVNTAFAGWGAFTVTTDPQLLAAGVFKVSGFGALPTDGVTLPSGHLFTLRFDIIPNQGTNSTAAVFMNENVAGTACEAGGVAPSYHPFTDIPTSSFYLNGGVTLNQHRKIKGVFTYYNNANTPLTEGDISVQLYRSSDLTHSTLLASAVTNGTGYYELDDLCPEDTYDIVATSTHETDGSVNTTDAGQVNYWPLSPYIVEKVRFYAGDVGTLVPYVLPDWNLNATDAQRIQQNFVNNKAFDRPWTFWRTNQFIGANPASESWPTVALATSGDATVNMYGLCTGDFNRSFNPALKKAASTSLTLTYGKSLTVTRDQEFDLPVRIVNATMVGAVSLILEFPANLVDVTGVTMNNTSGKLDWAVTGNQLRIGWHSGTPATLYAMDNLLTLRMKTRESFASNSGILLTLAQDPLNELANGKFEVIENAVLQVDIAEGSAYGIDDPALGASMNFRNYPNPFKGTTTFEFTLPYGGDVTIDIRNSFGVTVRTVSAEGLSAGDHSLKLDAYALPAGLYTAAIALENRSNRISSVIKVMVGK